MLAVDLGDDGADAALPGVERGDDIVAVVAGERDERIRRADALLLKNVAVRGVAVDDRRVGDEIAQRVAAGAVALDNGDGHARFLQKARQVHGDAPAAHDEHVFHGLFVLAHSGEKPPQLARRPGYAELVAPAQHKIAVRDKNLAPALHHAHQHRRLYLGVQALELYAVELFPRQHTVLHDLNTALGEYVHARRAREAQDARDLARTLKLRVDDHGKPQRLPEEARLGHILRVAYARDDVRRAETARGDAAYHVHLVAARRRDEKVGILRPGADERFGVGGVALYAYNVQRIGHHVDDVAVLIYNCDVMPLVGQRLRHGKAAFSRAGDYNLHIFCLLLSDSSLARTCVH